jgi:hypothetical protein
LPDEIVMTRGMSSTHCPAPIIMAEKPIPIRDGIADSGGPPMGFGALRRLQKQAATNTGLTSPGCAAPSGFLGLLTRYSACNLSGLVSCR